MANIGNSLKEHRQVCGYTQSELAKQTGIKQQNISRWESNIHNPDILDCINLANFYNITLEELLGLDEGGTLAAPPTANAMHDSATLSEKEKALLKAFKNLLPETQDFILRTAQNFATDGSKSLKNS